jgi:hypothetical protein
VNATSDWVHLAFTVSQTACVVYINGEVATSSAGGTIDWTGCDLMSIASGQPNFAYWDHKSDLSTIDEIRIFNKALTKAEVQTIMNNEK